MVKSSKTIRYMNYITLNVWEEESTSKLYEIENGRINNH